MKKPLFAAAFGSAFLLSLSITAAQAADSVFMGDAENGVRWFVELVGAPTADGNSAANVAAEHARFRQAAAAAGLNLTERHAYSALFNGFSVEVNADDRKRLVQMQGVQAIYPVFDIAGPSPEEAAGSEIELAAAIGLTGARAAQIRGLTGAGIKVGIIDTGVDYDHPGFGGSGTNGTTAFPSARVVAGFDFVGDAYNAGGTGAALIPVPDANPDDCNGHGTHVAGIVGANGGGITGVAPGVTLGAYRVFGCTGSTSADIMIAAMEMAYADGMQVINQSIGSARQWPNYPTAQAASRLAKKGVVMVASIGNNGPGGSTPDALYAAGAPGVGDRVIGVASFDNGQRSFTVNGTPYGYNSATASPLAPQSGSLPLARTPSTTLPPSPQTVPPTAGGVEGCPGAGYTGAAITWQGGQTYAAGSFAGQAVLVRRGTCGFHAKAWNAMQAGASAVILYNNVAGAINPTVAGTPAITIPVVAITAAQGATLDGLIAAGPTTLNWSDAIVGFPFGTGGLISGFSSFGLTADLQFKPNIGAPGGAIFSTVPLEQGGGATISGTSMSSPHVAGGAALILQAMPKLKPAQILARMQNNANPANWSGNPSLGFLDYTFRQGAGMLDIIGVLDANTTIEPGQVAIGESDPESPWQKVRLFNRSNQAIKYTITHEPAVAAGPNTMTGTTYNITGTFNAPATVVFHEALLDVAPGSFCDIEFYVVPNAGLPDRSLYGGYIVATPDDGGPAYRVPYAGFKGDYQSTVVLTPTTNGYPWLAQQVGTQFQNRPSGATYTMVGNDTPFFLVHLDHQSRRLTFEVFDAVTGKKWHKISEDEFVGRNSGPNNFFAFGWDGTTFKGKASNPSQILTVPDGSYIVKLSVLKALGDKGNPAHTETWTSPVITIDRP